MTGQSLYGLCLTLENYPDVFVNFVALVDMKLAEGTRDEGFQARRERTRAERIRKLGRGNLHS